MALGETCMAVQPDQHLGRSTIGAPARSVKLVFTRSSISSYIDVANEFGAMVSYVITVLSSTTSMTGDANTTVITTIPATKRRIRVLHIAA